MEWKQTSAAEQPKYQRPKHRTTESNSSNIEDSRPWIKMHIESWRVRVARPRMQMDSAYRFTSEKAREAGKAGGATFANREHMVRDWSKGGYSKRGYRRNKIPTEYDPPKE